MGMAGGRFILAGAICVCMTAGPFLQAAAQARHLRRVTNESELADAIRKADAGDDIVLADGIYVITEKLLGDTPGSAAAPVRVRAEHLLGARVMVNADIGFEVVAPYWYFWGLDIQGICARDTECEHAIHVVGHTTGFRLQSSRLRDFNAHLKVNANANRDMPDGGLVEDNEFSDTHARRTGNPVAPINIDNAVSWVVRGNLIHDFQKDGPGEDAYGAFVKGGSISPVIEGNLIECAASRPALGTMVGFSLGAHGMDANLCPPHWDRKIPCDPEVTGAVIRNNVIGSCNSDGIYLNKATGTQVLFNTLVHTGGIDARFASTDAVLRGNLMTGGITARDGAKLTDAGNRTGLAGDAAIAAAQPALPGHGTAPGSDYCGKPRPNPPHFGATEGQCQLLHWPWRK